MESDLIELQSILEVLQLKKSDSKEKSHQHKLLKCCSSLKIYLCSLKKKQDDEEIDIKAQRKILFQVLLDLVCSMKAAFFPSEFVQSLLADLFSLCYDRTMMTTVMNLLATKNSSQISTAYGKLLLIVMVSKLPSEQIHLFVLDVTVMAYKLFKNLGSESPICRNLLLTSLCSVYTNCVDSDAAAVAFKLASKGIVDKYAEVRVSSTYLLAAIHSSLPVDSVLSLTTTYLDDDNAELRRSISSIIGSCMVFSITNCEDNPNQSSTSSTPSSKRQSTGTESPSDDSSSNSTSSIKKTFKLPQMSNIPSSLVRKKTPRLVFGSIKSTIVYLKNLKLNGNVSRYFSSIAVVITEICTKLCKNFLASSVLTEILEEILSLLDLPLDVSSADWIRIRYSVMYIIRNGIGRNLIEIKQHEVLKTLVESLSESTNYHRTMVILVEASHLICALGDAVGQCAELCYSKFYSLLSHEKHSVRYEAAVALSSLGTSVSHYTNKCITSCLQDIKSKRQRLADDSKVGLKKKKLYELHGKSGAINLILRKVFKDNHNDFYLSSSSLAALLHEAEQLVEAQFDEKSLDGAWLACSRAGWCLIAGLSLCDNYSTCFSRKNLDRLTSLWEKSMSLQSREPSHELVRMEATLIALSCFLRQCHHLEALYIQSVQLLHGFLQASQNELANPIKPRGKRARIRVAGLILNVFIMIPPKYYADSYSTLLNMIQEIMTSSEVSSFVDSDTSNSPSFLPNRTSYLEQSLCADDDILECTSRSHLTKLEAPHRQDPSMIPMDLKLCVELEQETVLADMEIEMQYLDRFLQISSSPISTIRLVDSSVILFGKLFSHLPQEMKCRSLVDFANAMSSPNPHCIENICASLHAMTRELYIKGCDNPDQTWLDMTRQMLIEMLGQDTCRIRRGAAESIGMLKMTYPDSFLTNLVKQLQSIIISSEKEQNTSVNASMGAALALTHLKLKNGSQCVLDTTCLYQMAEQYSRPLHQVWGLHCWTRVLSSVSMNNDYEQYIKSSLILLERQLSTGYDFNTKNNNRKNSVRAVATAAARTSLIWSLGRLINTLVSALGPEIVVIKNRLEEILCFWDCFHKEELVVQLEYWKFMEQVAIFAHHVLDESNVSLMLQMLQNGSPEKKLRGVILSCLRLLVERKPCLIRQYKLEVILIQLLDKGLGGQYFLPLPISRGLANHHQYSDTPNSLQDIKETLFFFVDLDGKRQPCYWALLCRHIIVSSTSTLSQEVVGMEDESESSLETRIWRRTKATVENQVVNLTLPMRWQTKKLAVQCVDKVLHHLVQLDGSLYPHFNLSLAQSKLEVKEENYMCFYLDELVTLACHAATSSIENCELRDLQSSGLVFLQNLLKHFRRMVDSTTSDLVLKQYEAHITSSLRGTMGSGYLALLRFPSLLIPSYKTVAFTICHSIVEDPISVRRMISLILEQKDLDELVIAQDEFSLAKIEINRLACLAEIYIFCREDPSSTLSSTILKSIRPVLSELYANWLDIVLCHAVLSQGILPWPSALTKNQQIKNFRLDHSRFLKGIVELTPLRNHVLDVWPAFAKAISLTSLCNERDANIVIGCCSCFLMEKSTTLQPGSLYLLLDTVYNLLQPDSIFLGMYCDFLDLLNLVCFWYHATDIRIFIVNLIEKLIKKGSEANVMDLLNDSNVDFGMKTRFIDILVKICMQNIGVCFDFKEGEIIKTKHEILEVIRLTQCIIPILTGRHISSNKYIFSFFVVSVDMLINLAHDEAFFKDILFLVQLVTDSAREFKEFDPPESSFPCAEKMYKIAILRIIKFCKKMLNKDSQTPATLSAISFAINSSILYFSSYSFLGKGENDLNGLHGQVIQVFLDGLNKDLGCQNDILFLLCVTKFCQQMLHDNPLIAHSYFGHLGQQVLSSILQSNSFEFIEHGVTFLALVFSVVDEDNCEKFIGIFLPVLIHALRVGASNQDQKSSEKSATVQFVLHLAQKKSPLFKKRITCLSNDDRTVLEASLRAALSTSTSKSETKQKLDLSKYK